ncbi:MAG TPA: PIG-L deacetylase family protein [Magnetospirillaceae bacterium]|nr:PIG-L deacetylase family protein [Magnetospirillaceae bacterium]
MNILVVAAHPDDELLGCAGTIARHAAAGDHVHILIAAEGATARAVGGQAEVQALQQAARKAATILGAEPPRFAGLPDNRMDSRPILDITQIIEAVVEEVKPAVVYTHHGGDLNRDHRILHEAVVTACRPLPGRTIKKLLTFETLSSTEWASESVGAAFRPRHFVDITETLEAKLLALDCYRAEMRTFPHPRSGEAVAALAALRGSQVGLLAAEAFDVVYEIQA